MREGNEMGVEVSGTGLERGLEYCSICDELTEIAIRCEEVLICYHCADDAE